MKDQGSKIRLAASVLLGSVASAFAFDANTLAFYPFTDGDAGDSAVGQTIRNGVSSSYAGTPALSANASLGSVAFSADAPAKYIFAGKGGTAVATNIQSLVFNGTMVRSKLGTDGANVVFADLGTAISACDEYTVEFFWKIGEEDVPGVTELISSYVFSSSISYADGSHTSSGSSEGVVNVNLPEYLTYGRFWIGGPGNKDVNAQAESFLYNTYSGWKVPSIVDGKWHHFALTHSKTKNLTRLLTDYTDQLGPSSRNGANRGSAITNETLTTSFPFNLGNFIYHGKFAGLRVTSRVLSISELLYASNDERYFTDMSDTVCHWRFEEPSGTSVGTIANEHVPVDFHTLNPDLFCFEGKPLVATTYSGEGAVSVASDFGTDWPVYTNELPNVRARNVTDGESREKVIGPNEGALAIIPSSYQENKLMGVRLPTDNYRHTADGSFTVECFMRFDVQKFRDIGAPLAPKTYPGSLLIQADTPGTDRACDWQYRFHMQPNAEGTAWNYLVMAFGGYKMVNGSPSFVENSLGSFGMTTKYARGEWFHVAFVYEDKPPYQLKCYFDYVEKSVIDMGDNPLRRIDGNRIVTFGRWAPVLFDEIRISRKALAPEEFLHLNRPITGMTVIVR